MCYAVSEDGLNWTKPELGLIDFQGNKAKNLILRGAHGLGVALRVEVVALDVLVREQQRRVRSCQRARARCPVPIHRSQTLLRQ